MEFVFRQNCHFCFVFLYFYFLHSIPPHDVLYTCRHATVYAYLLAHICQQQTPTRCCKGSRTENGTAQKRGCAARSWFCRSLSVARQSTNCRREDTVEVLAAGGHSHKERDVFPSK